MIKRMKIAFFRGEKAYFYPFFGILEKKEERIAKSGDTGYDKIKEYVSK